MVNWVVTLLPHVTGEMFQVLRYHAPRLHVKVPLVEISVAPSSPAID